MKGSGTGRSGSGQEEPGTEEGAPKAEEEESG
jgi:hypothetical protein